MRPNRADASIAHDSHTETYAALQVLIDNWRWQDVPFYLRTGKCLPRQVSEVAIHFRAVPHQSFPPGLAQGWCPSRLVLSIQPDEGITLGFQVKIPGLHMLLRPVEMRFRYSDAFTSPSPEAYETLLWDVMHNDPTVFMREAQIEAAWGFLMPVLEVWANSRPPNFPNYAPGGWGPKAADKLIRRDGHDWRPVA